MSASADEPTVHQVSSRVVYQNPWMTLREDVIERSDGSRGIYSVVDKPDFALIIPDEGGGFHLVEEYRYPVRRRTWAFPQGTLPDRKDADPQELARIELAQETGLRAGLLVPLGFLHCSHGTSGQGCHVFLARQLKQGTPQREPEEQDMRHAWVSRHDFEQMIRDGDILDDSTLAAYLLMQVHNP